MATEIRVPVRIINGAIAPIYRSMLVALLVPLVIQTETTPAYARRRSGQGRGDSNPLETDGSVRCRDPFDGYVWQSR